MTTQIVVLITLLVGIIYTLILSAWDHSHRFQGSPFTILQVTIGMIIILSGVALAVFTEAITTAREAFWVLLACTAAVGVPIAIWYWASFDRHMSEIE